MRAFTVMCVVTLAISACADKVASKDISVEEMDKVKSEGQSLYGDTLSFSDVYQNNKAVCGNVIKDGKEQRFIYVRGRFLLEERSPSGEWESQWITECDPS